jgi:hypothetical protein
VRPQDRPQTEAQFRALLDADLPAPPTAALVPVTTSPVSHEPFAGTEQYSFSTVPGTLQPVLATQLLARAPAESVLPADAADSMASGFAGSTGPASLSPMAPDSISPASRVARRTEDPRPQASRLPLVVVVLLIVALGVGVALFWVMRPHGFAGSEKPVGEAASAVAAPLAAPAPAASPPAASAVALPSAASASLPAASMGPAASSIGAPVVVEPVPPMAASAGEIVRPAAGSVPAPASSGAPGDGREASTATSHEASTPTTAPIPSTRPRREPATAAHVETPQARSETPRRPAAGARCSDILQKASLEPLTAEEAAYLKRECR